MTTHELLYFPLDYAAGANLTYEEKISAVRKVGSTILLTQPELAHLPGDFAISIHEQVGSGVGFSLSATYALELAIEANQ